MGVRVRVERTDGTFYASWSMQHTCVQLDEGEFCADTWGDHHGLMASAMLSTGMGSSKENLLLEKFQHEP
jgi:hypothetical protein